MPDFVGLIQFLRQNPKFTQWTEFQITCGGDGLSNKADNRDISFDNGSRLNHDKYGNDNYTGINFSHCVWSNFIVMEKIIR